MQSRRKPGAGTGVLGLYIPQRSCGLHRDENRPRVFCRFARAVVIIKVSRRGRQRMYQNATDGNDRRRLADAQQGVASSSRPSPCPAKTGRPQTGRAPPSGSDPASCAAPGRGPPVTAMALLARPDQRADIGPRGNRSADWHNLIASS
jgi:hypothetical protein